MQLKVKIKKLTLDKISNAHMGLFLRLQENLTLNTGKPEIGIPPHIPLGQLSFDPMELLNICCRH
jgi:hypothetical protein